MNWIKIIYYEWILAKANKITYQMGKGKRRDNQLRKMHRDYHEKLYNMRLEDDRYKYGYRSSF